MKQHGGNYPFELQNGRITQHTEQRRWTKIRKVWMKWRDRWKCVRVRVCTHVRHTSMWFQWFPVYTSMCSGKTIAPAATCRYIRIGIKKKEEILAFKRTEKIKFICQCLCHFVYMTYRFFPWIFTNYYSIYFLLLLLRRTAKTNQISRYSGNAGAERREEAKERWYKYNETGKPMGRSVYGKWHERDEHTMGK